MKFKRNRKGKSMASFKFDDTIEYKGKTYNVCVSGWAETKEYVDRDFGRISNYDCEIGYIEFDTNVSITFDNENGDEIEVEYKSEEEKDVLDIVEQYVREGVVELVD